MTNLPLALLLIPGLSFYFIFSILLFWKNILLLLLYPKHIRKLLGYILGCYKLFQAGAIREVEYPEWLANVVVVKKANSKWRLCIDFTDVNRACPKDSFPLPRINLIVDATVGQELLSFMDAFSGYNQISMDPDDQEKTSFITGQGTYYYRVIPFGLKNPGDTYQRLVNRMFQKQIGASMEVYIYDMLVKSTMAELYIAHLSEAFQILREYNMKLNPAKCAFGVSAEKFLGFIVNNRGIEANPDKIKAVLDMPPSSNIKEVQRLTGRIVTLSRFVSKSSDKCQPFFQVLYNLLLQPSSERSRGEVSKDGETNPGVSNRSLEAPPLLSSSYH